MSDVFADAFALLAAAADVKGLEARIMRFKKLSEQVAAEQAQLAADREAHGREVAEAKAELDRRRAGIVADEAELRLRREALNIRTPSRSSAADFPHDPNFNPGTRSHTGLVRDRHHD
jgi:hypothetical protein